MMTVKDRLVAAPLSDASDVAETCAQTDELTWLSLARAASAVGNRARLQECYENVLVCNAWNQEAIETLVQVYLQTSAFAKAAKLLRQLLQRCEPTAELWASCINSYIEADMLEDAQAALDEATSTFAGRNELLFCEGLLHERRSKLECASAKYSKLLMMTNTTASLQNDTMLRLAYVQAARGEPYQSHANQIIDVLLQRSISTAVHCDALTLRGELYETTGNLSSAELAYRTALQVLPAHPQAREKLICLYLRYQETLPAAIEQSCTAIEFNPDSATAWYLLGRSFAACGVFNQAWEAYTKSLQLNPNEAKYWCSLGALYQRYNQVQEALGMYSRAVALSPTLPEAWFNVGLLYETAGQAEDANKAFTMAQQYGLGCQVARSSPFS